MRIPLMILPLLLAGCATPDAGNGRETREWLALQKSGAAASAETPTMSGEAAEKAYKRYLDSFGHPLPENFTRESIVGNGGGGQQ